MTHTSIMIIYWAVSQIPSSIFLHCFMHLHTKNNKKHLDCTLFSWAQFLLLTVSISRGENIWEWVSNPTTVYHHDDSANECVLHNGSPPIRVLCFLPPCFFIVPRLDCVVLCSNLFFYHFPIDIIVVLHSQQWENIRSWLSLMVITQELINTETLQLARTVCQKGNTSSISTPP